MSDITQMDLYALFDIDETSSSQKIQSAFRTKALTCHPDKFPGDREKNELFLLIKKAVELLTDVEARKAYDACRKQKKVQEQRLAQMDDKRKKFKETLEKNEQKLTKQMPSATSKTNDDRLRAEIERLRREGNRLVTEELEKIHQIIEDEKQQNQRQRTTSSCVHVRVKYLTNSQNYTNAELQTIFSKYGNITAIANGSSKSALIEFNTDHVSKIIENERGFDEKPFASVKIQKKLISDDATPMTSKKRNAETIDLTAPDFEEFEQMMLRKMSEQAAKS